MKKTLSHLLLATVTLVACSKSNTADDITITASTTETTVGQIVTVTAGTSANTLSWSANPSGTVTAAYAVTTEKNKLLHLFATGRVCCGGESEKHEVRLNTPL